MFEEVLFCMLVMCIMLKVSMMDNSQMQVRTSSVTINYHTSASLYLQALFAPVFMKAAIIHILTMTRYQCGYLSHI